MFWPHLSLLPNQLSLRHTLRFSLVSKGIYSVSSISDLTENTFMYKTAVLVTTACLIKLAAVQANMMSPLTPTLNILEFCVSAHF